jgi:hypothetical protein
MATDEAFADTTGPDTWITATSYTFYNLEYNKKYYFRVKARDGYYNESGYSVWSAIQNVTAVLSNYPNPFSERTTIYYFLDKNVGVRINIYDAFGRPVWTKDCPAGSPGGSYGENEVSWNGRNNFGDMVGNGTYILQLVIKDTQVQIKTRKMGIAK